MTTSSATDTFILFAGVFIWFITIINFFIYFPLIFKFRIIPEIERKIGGELKFVYPAWNWYPFGKFYGAPLDIARYITIAHFNLPISQGKKFALSKVHYPKEMISKSEVKWCVAVWINVIVSISSILLGYLFAK